MPLVVWGALLLVLTAVQLPFGPSAAELALLGGAGAACVLAGAVVLVAGRRRPAGDERTLPDLSPAVVLIALGLSGLLVGAEAGPWLMFIGGGLTLIGVGGLVRERRAERS
jgi:hypothetical protein